MGNYFKKLFGSKKPEAPKIASAADGDPAKDTNMIRVFDNYGRELFITREQWRDSILRDHLKKVWNDPDGLSSIITQSLHDKFLAEMVEPAEHLLKIDPNAERAAILLAVTYLQLKHLDDAEEILQKHIQKHGESGWILTNLAKVYSGRGENARSVETLWRGLQLDPNQDNAVGWYEAIHREKGGREESLAALRRIAAVPGSWRSQLWLARAALEDSNLPEALHFYRESIAKGGNPVPQDLLTQMSGDLGNAGYLLELIDITLPHFNIEVHGLRVGNNLIKAYLDLGQIDDAGRLLQQLYGQNRPDWKQTLSFWDTEIAKARTASAAPLPPDRIEAVDLKIDGPIWLAENSPVQEFFPAGASESVRICFLGSTAEMAADGDKTVRQMTDTPGRLSRAIPLFFAEQTHFYCDAKVWTLIPWIKTEEGGFILGGASWQNDDAASRARMDNVPSDYVVVSHLRTVQQPWRIQFRLLRTIDSACLDSFEIPFAPLEPGDAIRTATRNLIDQLKAHTEITPAVPPPIYQVPTGPDFQHYLVRLEQLLAVRCSGMERVKGTFLSSERDILDGNLQLCLSQPKNSTVRILLFQTFRSMQRVRPDIAAEYREKLERLQREHPVEQPIQRVLRRMLDSQGSLSEP